MTLEQVTKLVLAMAAAWPTLEADEYRIQTWATMLSDIRLETAILALQVLMARNTFPPSIAEFRKTCWEIETPAEDRIDEGQAWGMVSAAVKEVLENQQRSYAPLQNLPPKVYAGCKEIGLNELVNGDPDVVRSNFMRLYRGASERARNEAVVPATVKEAILRLQAGELNGLPGVFGIVPANRKPGNGREVMTA